MSGTASELGLTGEKRTIGLRDGPLENLWGGGVGCEVQKKYSRKGKLNETNFMQAN